MKSNLVDPVVASFLLFSTPCWVGCNEKPEQGAAPKSTAAATSKGLVVEGERFSVRTIPDSQQGGMVVGAFSAPEKWHIGSQVIWNYQQTESPVAISMSAEDPDNCEACFGYPALQFFGLRPDGNYYRPGQIYLGLIFAHQQQPAPQILLAFIQQIRGGRANLKFIGSKDLPDLPTALKLPPADNQRGVAIKVTYDLDGKPAEEEFYAVSYSMSIPYDGPQGRTWELKWGLANLHSFRAPVGTLDKRRAVFAAIAKSFHPNPVWVERRNAINAYLTEQFNQQLKAGYDSIAAAGRLSRQISANNAAMIASIDRQLAASRPASGGSSAASTRSSNDNFDDYIRGVDTVEDPYRATSQHSSNEQYHWTDGYGNYRNSNEASYDPNQHENGSWQLMPSVR